jgi:hypothetical protein
MVHSMMARGHWSELWSSSKCSRAEHPKNRCLLSDELPHYEHALANTYSTVVMPHRTGKKERPRCPLRIIHNDLDYATVQKSRSKGRVVNAELTLILGNHDRMTARLENSDSNKIKTSFVERLNLTLRMINAHLTRKSLCFAKSIRWLRARFSFIDAFYNFVRLHSSLGSNHYPVTQQQWLL